MNVTITRSAWPRRWATEDGWTVTEGERWYRVFDPDDACVSSDPDLLTAIESLTTLREKRHQASHNPRSASKAVVWEVEVSEAHFTDRVIEYAKERGWRVCHFRAAKTAKGWRTPIQGDKGFPDLAMARDGRVLLVELKAKRGRVSDDQKAWAREIGLAYHLWRPDDWPTVEDVLK